MSLPESISVSNSAVTREANSLSSCFLPLDISLSRFSSSHGLLAKNEGQKIVKALNYLQALPSQKESHYR